MPRRVGARSANRELVCTGTFISVRHTNEGSQMKSNLCMARLHQSVAAAPIGMIIEGQRLSGRVAELAQLNHHQQHSVRRAIPNCMSHYEYINTLASVELICHR